MCRLFYRDLGLEWNNIHLDAHKAGAVLSGKAHVALACNDCQHSRSD